MVVVAASATVVDVVVAAGPSVVVLVPGRLVVVIAVMFVHTCASVMYEQEHPSPDENDTWSPLNESNGPLRYIDWPNQLPTRVLVR